MAPPLWVKSHYSFLEGASSPEELVDAAADAGHTHLALTDRHNLYGSVRAHVQAKKRNIRLLVGAELFVAPEKSVVLLALDEQSYPSLCSLISQAQLEASAKGHALLSMSRLVTALSENSNLICLCASVSLLTRLAASAHHHNLFVLCSRQFGVAQQTEELARESLARRLGLPCVAAVEVLYHDRQRRALQDIVTCMRHHTTLEKAGLHLRANAEHVLPSPERMKILFKDRPAWLDAACKIAERARFDFQSLRYRYPSGRLAKGQTVETALRNRVEKGARWRFGDKAQQASIVSQLDHEMEVITQLDYGGYFLSMEEIVGFCRQNNILCQGRGSAANSLVCYCLGITAVNPLRMELLFERFVSQARNEPPDIDLDIEHQRREEVVQWVYSQYGRDHAAMVANVVRFRWRSAIRQVGQVLGLSHEPLDKLARLLGNAYGPDSEGFSEQVDLPQRAQEAGLDITSARVAHLMRLTMTLLDVPRHLSVHPGGFVLGQKPIAQLCPIEPATMPGRTIVPWDRHDVASLGLFKVDLLGLGALSQVRRTFELIELTEQKKLCMASVPQEDAKVYRMLSAADAIGVFQVESRAQLTMLPRLKPKTFYDLVVEVAIVRPGPIQGDMVHPYLRQRSLGHQPEYPHPTFEKVLGKTWGVPIFQEQVMKLAIMAADYSPGEADLLRRDMAAWRSHSKLQAHHQRIVTGMIGKGIPPDFAERVFKQIKGFGEYGFPESHAASFAHIVYVTAYLRCYYLPAFVCGLLNAQPMGFYSPNTIIEDAKRHGVTIRPIAINDSAWECTLEPIEQSEQTLQAPSLMQQRWAVRMGLSYIKGFGVIQREKLSQGLGPYDSVAQVAQKTGLNQRDMLALIRSGATEGLGQQNSGAVSRPSQLWHTLGWQQQRQDELLKPGHQDTEPMPKGLARAFSKHEAVAWDLAASHHSARGHPISRLRPQLQARGCMDAKQVQLAASGTRLRTVGWVVCRQRPQTAHGTLFLTLEDESGLINVVLWPRIVEKFYSTVVGHAVLGVSGVVERQESVVHLIASHVFPLSSWSCEPIRSKEEVDDFFCPTNALVKEL